MNIVPVRRVRFLFWVLRELVVKYRRSLIVGFLAGLAVTIALGRVLPLISKRTLSSIERIGIVGEFSPTSLPLFIQQKISNGLTTLSLNGSPEPSLAVSWESTDSGKLYTFHLRSDQKWHNGREVSAKDVNYNIRGVTFQARDDKTLEAHLATPYSPLPVLTSKPIFLAGLRGFGPYRVAGIRLKGDMVEYLKLVSIDSSSLPTLEYRFYRTEALAILAFQRGDVDILTDMSSVNRLSNWRQVTISEHVNDRRVVTLFFNLRKEILKEKSFRQALGYALPELPGERVFSPIGRTSWAYTDNVKQYGSNPSQAKKLFSASTTATSSAQLTITTFPSYLEIAQTIASRWSSLGISTAVKITGSVDEDFDVLLSGQDLPPDPDQYPFWHSTQTQTNITGYSNVKIDKLLEDGRQEQDIEKRKTIYADFQRRLVDDAPAIFLYYPKTYTIKRGRGK